MPDPITTATIATVSAGVELIRRLPETGRIVSRAGRSLSKTLALKTAKGSLAEVIAGLLPVNFPVVLPHKGQIPDEFFTFCNPSTRAVTEALLVMMGRSTGHFGADEVDSLKSTMANDNLIRAQHLLEVTEMIRLQKVNFNGGVDPPQKKIRTEPHLEEKIAILTISLERENDGSVGLAGYEITDGKTIKVVDRGQENFYKVDESSLRDDLLYIRGCPEERGLIQVGLFTLSACTSGGVLNEHDCMRFLISRSWMHRRCQEVLASLPQGSGKMSIPLNVALLKKLTAYDKQVREEARKMQQFTYTLSEAASEAVAIDGTEEPIPLLTDLVGDEWDMVASFCARCKELEEFWFDKQEAGLDVQASILFSSAGENQLAEKCLPEASSERKVLLSEGRLGTMIYIPFSDCVILSTFGMPDDVVGERPFCPLDASSPEVLAYLGKSILGLGMSKQDDTMVIKLVAAHMNTPHGSLGNPLPVAAKNLIHSSLQERGTPFKMTEITQYILTKSKKMADDPQGVAVAVRGTCAILAAVGIQSTGNGLLESFRFARSDATAMLELECDTGVPLDLVVGKLLSNKPFVAVVGDLYTQGKQIVVTGESNEVFFPPPKYLKTVDKAMPVSARGLVRAVTRPWQHISPGNIVVEFHDCTCR